MKKTVASAAAVAVLASPFLIEPVQAQAWPVQAVPVTSLVSKLFWAERLDGRKIRYAMGYGDTWKVKRINVASGCLIQTRETRTNGKVYIYNHDRRGKAGKWVYLATDWSIFSAVQSVQVTKHVCR